MPGASSIFFAASAAAAVASGATYNPEAGQPAWFGSTATLEKVYISDGKVVATPMIDYAQADEKCPKGYVIRNEGREERGSQVVLTWTLACQPRER